MSHFHIKYFLIWKYEYEFSHFVSCMEMREVRKILFTRELILWDHRHVLGTLQNFGAAYNVNQPRSESSVFSYSATLLYYSCCTLFAKFMPPVEIHHPSLWTWFEMRTLFFIRTSEPAVTFMLYTPSGDILLEETRGLLLWSPQKSGSGRRLRELESIGFLQLSATSGVFLPMSTVPQLEGLAQGLHWEAVEQNCRVQFVSGLLCPHCYSASSRKLSVIAAVSQPIYRAKLCFLCFCPF